MPLSKSTISTIVVASAWRWMNLLFRPIPVECWVLSLSLGVGLFVWLVDGVLVYFAVRPFNRSRLLINMA